MIVCMNLRHVAGCGCAVVLLLGVNAGAAEQTNARRPDELREQLKGMSPSERDAKLKAYREEFGRARPEREEVEKLREELKGLSPAERQVKLKEYRAASAGVTNRVVAFSPEERSAKRKELRLRLESRMEEVRTNADLKLTEQERKQFLDRMGEVARSFDGGTNAGSGK
jgi:hypothetical protein